jgi:hypothetical protein
MNTVERILEFINNQSNESMTEQPTEQLAETENNEHIQNEELPTHESIPQPIVTHTVTHTVTPANDELTHAVNGNDYKQTLRQLNKLKNRNEFPCIAKIDGKNRIFNNDDELMDVLNQMKASRRLQLKEMKRQHIDNYKHFSEEYQQNDEDIEDDGLIYKRGDIVAVKKADKVYKAPRTNKKDRQRIYNSIKDNKKLLTDLTLAKDEEQFKTISSDNLRDEELNIYHKHRDNKINKDTTWTRSSFLAMMNRFINDDDRNNRPNTPAPQHNIVTPANPSLRGANYGLNPLLFGRM